MSPEYVTKEEYREGIFKLKKEIQEQRARYEGREKVMERMISRLWMERVIYISIIIGSVSILTTLIIMT